MVKITFVLANNGQINFDKIYDMNLISQDYYEYDHYNEYYWLHDRRYQQEIEY